MQKLKKQMMLFVGVIIFFFIVQCNSSGSRSGGTNTTAEIAPTDSTPVDNLPVALPEVIIDGNTRYQIINGFEVTILSIMNAPDSFGAPLPDIVDQLVKDFGFRFIKVRENLQDFEPINDNDLPLFFDWKTYKTVFAQTKLATWFQNIKAINDTGARIHLSTFFPPDWMSVPSDVQNRFRLDPDYPRPDLYQEIAELWAAPLVYLRDFYGVEVESMVVWNEATDKWSPFRFTQSEYVETVKAVGQRFQAENLATKILIADNGFISDARLTTTAILEDPDAAAYAGGIAYHTYDGFERQEPDKLIPALQGLANDTTIASSGRELRMTEWAPTGADPLTGQTLVWAKQIYNCHVYGRTSVVDLWAVEPLAWSQGDPSAVLEDNGVGKLHWRKHIYAFKQFAKFVDPGSRRIQASLSDVPNVYVTAYDNDQTGRFTIVIINRGATDDRIHFEINNIQGLTALDVIRTSASENTAVLGPVSIDNNAFDYNIQGESITTFTGTR